MLPVRQEERLTMDRITTHGRFNLLTMACEMVDFPEPEEPAMPIMLTSAQGGAYDALTETLSLSTGVAVPGAGEA